jgi:putative outer membrane protein, probably involved in nutrient binding
MKKIIKVGVVAMGMLCGMTSCDSFFAERPGIRYDLEMSFKDRVKTVAFLANVYSFVPAESREMYFWDKEYHGGFWTVASLEGQYTADWHASHDVVRGKTDASSGQYSYFYRELYKGIERASTFIANVDKCEEIDSEERKNMKGQARALRAYYYFLLMRMYGPIPLLGDAPISVDAPLDQIMIARSPIDDCVKFITDELDTAYDEVTYVRATGSNMGHVDKAFCKAYKAKTLLFAASPLFNGNPDMASLKNQDGTQLIPTTEDTKKWELARDAYKDFLSEFDGIYKLHTVTKNGRLDPYESYRQATSGEQAYVTDEMIWFRESDNCERSSEVTPGHRHLQNDMVRGQLSLSTNQEMVDLYFTDKGLRIEDDPDYSQYEYSDVPDESLYTLTENYDNPADPDRNYFLARNEYENKPNYVLKQWLHREPRFYANITVNGSTWLNTSISEYGKITTDLTVDGNSGFNQCQDATVIAGYAVRKMARQDRLNGKYYDILLRLAEVYLDYAETLSATGDYKGAMDYVNKIRHRAGIAEYGTGTDANGFQRITYPENRTDVDNRIRRERTIELMFEWNHYFDVRRWRVADMEQGDGWVYPTYHNGGEGGEVHGMSYKENVPKFFRKKVIDTRKFEKKNYLFPIPQEDILRINKLVQNPGWGIETPVN